MLAWLKTLAALGGLLSKLIDLARELIATRRAAATDRQHTANEDAIARAFDPVADPAQRLRQPPGQPRPAPPGAPSVPGGPGGGA